MNELDEADCRVDVYRTGDQFEATIVHIPTNLRGYAKSHNEIVARRQAFDEIRVSLRRRDEREV